MREVKNWTNHSEDEDYALMACNSSDSDTDRTTWSDSGGGDGEIKGGAARSQEPSELVSELVVNESDIECQPKVWFDAPIIEEYESDSEDDFNLENIVPTGGLACLIAKATTDESHKWHRRTKDETSAVLKDFIRQIENQLNQKVKTIRSDNGTEFKNKDVIEFCGSKGIKREYSNARTPQQNGVAERKNRTLIEAARTMLADSFLPNTFWAEAVSTACYVLNRVLVTKPHNKTPYELLTGKIPIISYIRPFGCHVTILNTIDHLGKFAGKSDEGFLVGYSLQSKAFRVYNLETKYYEDKSAHHLLREQTKCCRSENQANIHACQQEANHHAGTEDIIDAGDSEKKDESAQDCFNFKRQEKEANEEAEALRKQYAQENENLVIQAGAAKASSTNIFSTVSTPAKPSSTNLVNTVSIPVSTASPHEGLSLSDPTNPKQDDSDIPPLEEIYQNSSDGIFTTSSYDDEGTVADFTNLETVVNVSPIPTSRINSSHPSALILGDPTSAFEIQKVWILVDLPFGKKAIGTKIEAIRIFLAFASYMGFIVYQMDMKSAFLYGKIDEELLEPGFRSIPKSSPSNAVKRIFRVSKGKPTWALVQLECLHLTWNPTQIVTMLEQILTGNLQQEVVNFLAGDSFLGNAKSKPLWLLLLRRQNMLLLQALWASFVDSKSNVRLWFSTS
ncbi:putative ribonuclease H-like domain-containing protein [Tanacetum coccineum]